jgi:hypothetical protein
LKLRLASQLRSPALREDGVLTLATAALAAITLVALVPQLSSRLVVGGSNSDVFPSLRRKSRAARCGRALQHIELDPAPLSSIDA